MQETQVLSLSQEDTLEKGIATHFNISWASLVAQRLKCLPATWETRIWSLGWEDPLQKEMATHSTTLACRILWTEKPGGLQSTGSQRVGQDWVTSLSVSIFLEKEMATHSSVLAWRIPWTEEPGRLQSMGSQRVRHNWVTSVQFSSIFLPGEFHGQRNLTWWATVHRVTKNWIWLSNYRTK